MDAAMVADAVSSTALPATRPSPGQAVVSAVASALAPRYQESWLHGMAGAQGHESVCVFALVPGMDL